jgi:alginate O-acetyltransferase complex protein AlgI
VTVDSATIQFVLFGLTTAIVSNLNQSKMWRSATLLVASLLFLGMLSHEPTVLLPLLGFLLLGYFGLLLLRRGLPAARACSIVAIILAYVWLKKYTFLPDELFIRHPYFTLGLSYIFFRVLHLLIESADGGVIRNITLLQYFLYTLNFTTFVSGPIQRFDEFARDQFADHPISLSPSEMWRQLERIILGFFKVNVIAMLLDAVRLDALADLSQPLSPSFKLYAAFRLTVIYPLFLYANFSGYIDIVIGLARLIRVRLPENFDRPFSATSFLDFWNRWHITLSTWLKTYVYNPLLMTLMRRFSSPSMQAYLGVICFFVTFFLVGIWHGRTAEFAFFGVLQGGGVAANKLWQLWLSQRLGRRRYKALAANPLYGAFARGLTFTWFAFTLFWFWSTWAQIQGLTNSLGSARWILVLSTIWLCATAILAGWEWARHRLLSMQITNAPRLTGYARVAYSTALALAAFVLTVLLNQAAPGIVYKAF